METELDSALTRGDRRAAILQPVFGIRHEGLKSNHLCFSANVFLSIMRKNRFRLFIIDLANQGGYCIQKQYQCGEKLWQ